MIERIEKFAKDLCEKNEEDPHLFHHVLLVRDYAVKLAVIEGADVEVCEIAALLHDIGKCKGRRSHHILGRELAKGFLDSLDLPEEKKNLILKCIEKHRSRFSSEDNELEVKVIQSADCLGSLFNEQWQEYCRKTMSKKALLKFYEEKALQKINLESAQRIASPRLEYLKKMAGSRQ